MTIYNSRNTTTGVLNYNLLIAIYFNYWRKPIYK